MAQRFAAKRALVGADYLRPHPIPLHFTLWIDTLNRGARHDGHSELPQRLPTRPLPASPLGGQSFIESTERTFEFLRCALVVSTRNHPNA